MTPGPVEEGGKAASAIVESLKTSPVILALVIFNLAFIALVYVNARDLRDTFDRTMGAMLLQQAKMSEMLFNCTPAQPGPNR